jgi:hypothetical protein
MCSLIPDQPSECVKSCLANFRVRRAGCYLVVSLRFRLSTIMREKGAKPQMSLPIFTILGNHSSKFMFRLQSLASAGQQIP